MYVESTHIRNGFCYNNFMQRLNFFIPSQLLSALRSLSEKTGLKVSDLIRRSIEEYLKRQKR